MTIVATEDKRNLEWRNSNVGASLLQKMGWNEGDGLGKRAKSGHALRAIKRQDGLGIGASIQTEGGASESSRHLSDVLASLKAQHNPSESREKNRPKKSKKSKTTKSSSKKDGKDRPKKKKARTSKSRPESDLYLPQTKVTAGHARKMRESKFGKKSLEDLACIFGSKDLPTCPQEHTAATDRVSVATPEKKNKKLKKKLKKKNKKRAVTSRDRDE